MPYTEIITLCYEIQTKLLNTLCMQNVEFLNVRKVIAGFKKVKCADGII
jgi:hypothetical protein